MGPEVWETKRKRWGKLCSVEFVELKEATGDIIVAPSDADVRQVLIQEILKLLERDSDLAKEISSFMEDESVQKLMTADSSARIIKQNSKPDSKQDSKQGSKQNSKQTLIDRISVLEEFNRLLEAFVARKSTSQALDRPEVPDTEKPVPEPGISVTKVPVPYELSKLQKSDKSKKLILHELKLQKRTL